MGIAAILAGKQKYLYMGNLEAKRDWGFAGDYVEAMWLILQQEKPDDYVIATGEIYSVREFAERVFSKLDLDYKQYVEIDQKYFRPTEVDALQGLPSKANLKLGWKAKTTFDQLIDMMIDSDMILAKKEKLIKDNGFND